MFKYIKFYYYYTGRKTLIYVSLNARITCICMKTHTTTIAKIIVMVASFSQYGIAEA